MRILECLGGFLVTLHTFFFQNLHTGPLFKSQVLLILFAFTTDLNCICEHFYSMLKPFLLENTVLSKKVTLIGLIVLLVFSILNADYLWSMDKFGVEEQLSKLFCG